MPYFSVPRWNLPARFRELQYSNRSLSRFFTSLRSTRREIAADFREAAENGDMSSMQPPPPPQPPDGANGDQIGAYTQSASSGTLDDVMSIVKNILDDAISSL
jgi:hypothetical protein